MIKLSTILLIISFLLQGILSNFLGYTFDDVSMFSTVYVLITLLLISPYFENKRKYLLLLVIFGWLMDIVYSNTLLLNVSLFYLVYKFSSLFYFFFPENLVTVNLNSVLGVFIYHILSFIILNLLQFDNYSFMMLVSILSGSIVMSIIYTTVSYWGIKFVRGRIELKEVK